MGSHLLEEKNRLRLPSDDAAQAEVKNCVDLFGQGMRSVAIEEHLHAAAHLDPAATGVPLHAPLLHFLPHRRRPPPAPGGGIHVGEEHPRGGVWGRTQVLYPPRHSLRPPPLALHQPPP